MPTLREKIDAARADAAQAQPSRSGGVRSTALPSRAAAPAQPSAAQQAAERIRNNAAAAKHVQLSRGLPINTALYHSTALLVSLIVAELIWVALYLLNAFSTAWGSQPPINGFFIGLNRMISLVDPDSVIYRAAWVSWAIGFIFAVLSTFLEIHLWRSGSRRLFYFLGVPVMFWGHYTASQMVNMFFNGVLASPQVVQNFWATVGGDIIALVPEPMLVVTTATLIAVVRARKR